MKYFLDTEFLEGTQTNGQPFFEFWLGPKRKPQPTIELISIGIVSEDGREYYAISKDFNLKEAWNRFQWKDWHSIHNEKLQQKVYWIRENVLKPIYLELLEMELGYAYSMHEFFKSNSFQISSNDLKQFKRLINKYGKTNKQIAKEIKEFVGTEETIGNWEQVKDKMNTQFYGYYADYDWVVFCWLFGKMIDLPGGFPMYCIDLKQELDRIQEFHVDRYKAGKLETFATYPKQPSIQHHALEDAKWNKQLHYFLESI